MLMGMADVKGMAIPVRERVQPFGPTGVPSGVFTSRTYISLWQRMKPWPMPNESRPI